MAEALPDTPDPGSVMKEIARSAKAETNVANPAHVTSFDQAQQTVGLQLVQAHAYRDGKAAIARERPPILPSVPVAFPGGADWAITWPVSADDPGLAIVCDRSTDEWKTGGAQTTEPQDFRRHDLSDAVFFPGVRSPATPLPAAAYDPDALVIYGAQIKLGSSAATLYVAHAVPVATNFATLVAAIGTAVAAACTAAALKATVALAFAEFGTVFATSLASALTGFPVSMASTKVRAL